MSRSTLLASALALLVSSMPAAQREEEQALGPAPLITIVKLTGGDKLEMQKVRYVTEYRTRIHTVDDGTGEREVTEAYAVTVPVYVTSELAAEGLKVSDIDGNPIALEDVAERLSRPTPVLIVSGGKVPSIYRDLFQMGTLVLDLSPDPVAPVPSSAPLPPSPIVPPR